MRKAYAIISTNEILDYLFYVPLTSFSWNKENFIPIIFHNIDENNAYLQLTKKYTTNSIFVKIENDINIKNVTLVQTVRLYSFLLNNIINEDDYIIISDIDMIICNSFLYRDFDKINVFGHDLTGFREISMCYVGATKLKWTDIMKPFYNSITQCILADLTKYTEHKSDDFGKWWTCDQQILTNKLKEYGFNKLHFIHRGRDKDTGEMALGRLDRFNWKYPVNSELKDCHSLKKPYNKNNFNKIYELFEKLYQENEIEWIKKYYNEWTQIPKKRQINIFPQFQRIANFCLSKCNGILKILLIRLFHLF